MNDPLILKLFYCIRNSVWSSDIRPVGFAVIIREVFRPYRRARAFEIQRKRVYAEKACVLIGRVARVNFNANAKT